MHGHQRHVAAPLQFQDRCQLQPRKILKDVEHGLFVYAIFDIGVTLFAWEHDQAIGSDLLPEGLVIHGLKPVFNIIYVSEFHREYSISNHLKGLQIVALIQGEL